MTGLLAVQILKFSLDSFFELKLLRDPSSGGKPGEDVLSEVLNMAGQTVSAEDTIFVLRSLCKRSNVSTIFSSHGISLVRGRKIKIAYRCGESFSLDEFSMFDLDIGSTSLNRNDRGSQKSGLSFSEV